MDNDEALKGQNLNCLQMDEYQSHDPKYFKTFSMCFKFSLRFKPD